MELRSCIAFFGDSEILKLVDKAINEDGLVDDMVESLDYIIELETDETIVYRCETNDDSWVNIYAVLERLDINVDVVYAVTDSKTYVDVISTSGLFDAFVDTDSTKIQEICDSYGLEFFGVLDDDEDYYQDEEDEDDNNY